jgi:uncharacterized protein (TIGR02453 family)
MNGFGARVFAWFEGLERDNSKAYFTATRDFYESEVRGGLEALLDDLGGDVKVFRQQRNLRFSRDKTPYKTRTYGIAGRLYVAIDATGLYAGTGYYQMQRDQLDRFRAAIDAGPELGDAIASAEAAGLEVVGAAVKTAPRGYPRDHPRIELLRLKQLIAGGAIGPGDDGIPHERALEHARAMRDGAAPILAWLDAHVGPSELPSDDRYSATR